MEIKSVPDFLHKKRVDEALVVLFGISKSAGQRAIEEGRVLINSKIPHKSGEKVMENDSLSFSSFHPEEINLSFSDNIHNTFHLPHILFENNDFLIVEKPVGIPTHFDEHHTDCVVGRLLLSGKQLSSIGIPNRPGVVHRLDKDTSGLLLFAKTNTAHIFFQKLFASRKIKKTYFALVHGTHLPLEGTIDSPIGRDPKNRQKMRVAPENVGRNSVTHFYRKEKREKVSLLEINLETGRTHQIRVHLAAIGNPVVGDKVYGNPKYDEEIKPSRLFLHAFGLEFTDLQGIHHCFQLPISQEEWGDI